jgi:hypothetical protein
METEDEFTFRNANPYGVPQKPLNSNAASHEIPSYRKHISNPKDVIRPAPRETVP